MVPLSFPSTDQHGSKSVDRTMNSGFGPSAPRQKEFKRVRDGREKGGWLPGILGVGRTGKAPAPVPPSMLRALHVKTPDVEVESQENMSDLREIAPGLPQRQKSPLLDGAHAPQGTPKGPRTNEEAERLKLARRTEIECRCSELNRLISPSLLTNMPSFQASLHILKPLDDTGWDMLKPRLLAQRADAERREKEWVASTRALEQFQLQVRLWTAISQRSEESTERE